MADKTKYSEGDLVEVRFYDITDKDDWIDIKEGMMLSCIRCKTIGYVLNETDRDIVLTASTTDDDDCVELVCRVADTDWMVISSIGNIIVT